MKGALILILVAAVVLASVGCTSDQPNSNPESGNTGIESYVASLAGTESDDVTCEDDGVGDSSYFCAVDSGDPADCFHVFADGAGWSAYTLDGSLMKGPLFCPTG